MPKDSAPTRTAILAAAVHTLKRAGLEGFTVEGVARRAGVVKGLVLYHYASRSRLLRSAAAQIATERAGGLARALAKGEGGSAGVDACWEELRRQTEDGTTRAWMGLCAAGLIERTDEGGFEATARAALLDGCAAALAAGAPVQDVRDAYHALWLALLNLGEAAAD
ncbi:MAG TPA: TetR family transcriptional regulator [Gemmatimonadales bacterium]|nr:TetR family transcriptional regulator [Gemmatimonadales bacterium]